VRRRITQIMLILIMLFGLTAWTVGGRSPARPTPGQAEQSEIVPIVILQQGRCGRRCGDAPRRPVDYPYPVATEVAYP